MKSPNPALIYQHRPNYMSGGVPYTESHGILRSDEEPVEPTPGTLRIAALGDSVGAGYTLPYEERLFSRIEAALAKDLEQNVRVLNFCVTGYSTAQEAALLDEVVVPFKPDMVILQYCVNDFYPSETPARWFAHWPGDRSYLIAYLAHRYDPRLMRGFPSPDSLATLYRTDEKGWRSVSQSMRHIGDYCRSRKIPAVLAIFPAFFHQGFYAGDATNRHGRVAALGRASGFEVVDLLPVYAPYKVDTMRLSAKDNLHPNAAGYQVAADALVPTVRRLIEIRN